jgi:hypothetical protein
MMKQIANKRQPLFPFIHKGPQSPRRIEQDLKVFILGGNKSRKAKQKIWEAYFANKPTFAAARPSVLCTLLRLGARLSPWGKIIITLKAFTMVTLP